MTNSAKCQKQNQNSLYGNEKRTKSTIRSRIIINKNIKSN